MISPFYKELARQQGMQRQMEWRIRASEKLSIRFGFVVTASLFFYRPISFDVMLTPGMMRKFKMVKPGISVGNN